MSERRVSGNLGFTSADVSLIGAESCVVHNSYGVIRVFETPTGGLKLNGSHKARVPPGGIAGEVKKQRVVGSNALTTREPVFGIPRYYYVDVTATCAGCQQSFVFTKAEQRVMYEEHGIPVYRQMDLCGACRAPYERGEPLKSAIDAKKADSKNLALIVEEAHQRVLQQEYAGTGDLAKATTLLRAVEEKATDPGVRGDAFRWLAAVEDLRGRPKEALKHHQQHVEAHAAAPCPACAAAKALLG